MGEGEGGKEDGLIFMGRILDRKPRAEVLGGFLGSDGANAGGVGLNGRKWSGLGGLYTCATSESDRSLLSNPPK